ncbi:nuclear transport factor 2 family protein [Sphingobium chlorophenolicum]|nr:nuclear transport factor 2 family protein [Sphingobium chlorophenolicum]
MRDLATTAQDRIMLTQLLLANATDYWHEVDVNGGLNTRDYYLEDATFFNLKGREAIHQFYVWRQSRGPRVNRHVIANFRAELIEPGLARTNNVMMLFAGDGVPVLPSHAPIQIAEQIDHLVLCEDGRWRFRTREFVNLFKGDTPTTVPPRAWYEKWSPGSLKD